MKTLNFVLMFYGAVSTGESDGGEATFKDSTLERNLRFIVSHATENGLITGDSPATLEAHELSIATANEFGGSDTQFNHAYDVAFEVLSARKDAEDVTAQMLRASLIQRICSMSDTEILEACGAPFDTYTVERL